MWTRREFLALLGGAVSFAAKPVRAGRCQNVKVRPMPYTPAARFPVPVIIDHSGQTAGVTASPGVFVPAGFTFNSPGWSASVTPTPAARTFTPLSLVQPDPGFEFPDDTNTGWWAAPDWPGAFQQTFTSKQRIAGDNVTYSFVDFQMGVEVEWWARNVTFYGCRFGSNSTSNKQGIVSVPRYSNVEAETNGIDHTNIKFEYCEITYKPGNTQFISGNGYDDFQGADGSAGWNVNHYGIMGHNTSYNHSGDAPCIWVKRCNIHHVEDGMELASYSLVEESYIHHLVKCSGFTYPGNGGTADGHCDCIKVHGDRDPSKNIIIRNNFLRSRWQTSTSCMLFSMDAGWHENVLVENNFLMGGSFTVYLRENGPSGQGPSSNVTFRNNIIFQRGSGVWAQAANRDANVYNEGLYLNAPSSNPTFTIEDNQFEDGTPFNWPAD